MKPHKHAELIKAWADGAEIEVKGQFTDYNWWTLQPDYVPSWSEKNEYRIKPEPKPDVVLYADVSSCLPHLGKQFYANISCAYSSLPSLSNPANLKLTFDGETGELKSAEVLK